MTKIAVIINLPKNINNKIIKIKKFVKKNYGNQTYLNHPPHITLFTCDIKSLKEFKNYLKKINKSMKFNKKITIKTNKLKFFNEDQITKENTFYLSINKNKNLKILQEKIYKKLKPNIKYNYKVEQSLKDHLLKKNYLKYGYPFLGQIWVPHITIASMNKKININNLKKINPNNLKYYFNPKHIDIYKVVGNNHLFLDNIEIYD